MKYDPRLYSSFFGFAEVVFLTFSLALEPSGKQKTQSAISEERQRLIAANLLDVSLEYLAYRNFYYLK